MSGYLTTLKGAHVSTLAYAAAWPLRGLGRLRFHVSTRLVVLLLVTATVLTLVGDAFFYPIYQTSPLLLVLISPRREWLLLTADQLPSWQFFLLGTLRLSLFDPLYYLLGRRGIEKLPSFLHLWGIRHLAGGAHLIWQTVGGGTITRRVRSGGSRLSRLVPVERALGRYGLLLLLFVQPISVVMFAAGVKRINPLTVAVISVAGTIAYLEAIIRLNGWFF